MPWYFWLIVVAGLFSFIMTISYCVRRMYQLRQREIRIMMRDEILNKAAEEEYPIRKMVTPDLEWKIKERERIAFIKGANWQREF